MLKGGRLGRRDRATPHAQPLKGIFKPIPRWLPAEAKRFIREYSPMLIDRKMLSKWDRDAFVTLALLAWEIRDHTEALVKEGFTLEGRQKGLIKHPRACLLRNAEREFRLYCQEFGLTPVSRGRIAIEPARFGSSDMENLLQEMEKGK